MEELINCLFLQRTFLSNFPQSLSASEHTTDIHHPLSDSRNLSSSARCVYCALCPHPHLTDSVCVCFTACLCERVTVILVSGEERRLVLDVMSLVTGPGALSTPGPSHLPCPSCPGDQPRQGGASHPQSTSHFVF